MTTLAVGLTGEARLCVGPEHSAQSMGSGDVAVFSTPMLVALMEEAAITALRDQLPAGRTTVGTWIEVSHTAATPLGMDVRAEARLVGIDGRTLAFELVAWDAREKIGEGRHRRAIIVRDRFMARVGTKAAST